MPLAAAPAAPLAPAGVAIASVTGLLLVLLVASLATWATIRIYDHSLGALIRKLADMIEGVLPFGIGGFAADALDDVDRFILRQLARALDGLNEAVSHTWDGLTWVVRTTADAVYDLAAATTEAITGVVHGEVPTQIDAKTRPLTDRLSKTQAGVNERLRQEGLARSRGIDAVRRDLARESLAREHGIDALARRLNEAVIPRVRGLELALRDVVGYTRRTLARRLSRVEQLVLGSAIAAGALAVATRYFPFAQCTNVRRFNRLLCRSPIGALEWLFALLAFAVVALDPEQVAQLAEDVADELGDIVATMAGV